MKTFLSWMEGEETPALAEPQHKKGEANLRLDDITERRIRQMVMDLESSGKGTKEEVLASIMKNMKKMGVKDEDSNKQMQQQQGQENQATQETPPDMSPEAPPQAGPAPAMAGGGKPAGQGVVRQA